MSASDNNHLPHSRLLSQLQRQCQGRHGNMTIFPTTPIPESSTGVQGEVEDTDFGAVMYIAAVLVFYSLGIVVMIVKYLKTERKELEEEMALESFFKGIPSKKMEHNRDAVNRVAIRAFHTLTSGAKRQDQLLSAAQNTYPTTPDGDCLPIIQEPVTETSPHSEDSDSSPGEPSPYLLQREPSKYLPRVSLIFRDNRANDRRRTYDNIRPKMDLPPPHYSLPSSQRSLSTASAPLQENGRAGFCSRVPREISHHCDDSPPAYPYDAAPVGVDPHKRRLEPKRKTSQKNSVSFVDEKTRGKPSSKNRSRGKPRTSKSSQGRPVTTPAIKLYAAVEENHVDPPNTPTGETGDGVPQPARTSPVSNGAVSPAESRCQDSRSHSLEKVSGGDEQVVAPTTVTQQPVQQMTISSPRKLLVSDV